MPNGRPCLFFSSDALSSVRYGPEQIAIVLASVPTLATLPLFQDAYRLSYHCLIIHRFALSYTQVVRVNPGGGGSMASPMKYLGVYPALTAERASGRLHTEAVCRFRFFRDGGWSVRAFSIHLIRLTMTSRSRHGDEVIRPACSRKASPSSFGQACFF